MQELKDRIVKEGKILPGNIVKVDGFLNHRVDCAFMGRIADEFKKYFDLNNVDLILTAEASGIALSAICAYRYGKPMVYAKKAMICLRAAKRCAVCVKSCRLQVLNWSVSAAPLKRASRAAATSCARRA